MKGVNQCDSRHPDRVIARDGDIVILHFNRPKSGTREGLREALPELLARGVIFVRLADVKVE